MNNAQVFEQRANVSRETMEMYSEWLSLLTHWNKTINLVSSTTIGEFWQRHALDSYQLIDCLPKRSVSILDLGSGAGFPGLALAISLKQSKKGRVILVESNGKKCNFLRTVIRELGLPAKVAQERVEVFGQQTTQYFDVISARAFAPLPKLLAYSEPFWGDSTLGVFPKGRDWQGEINSAKTHWGFDVNAVQSQTDPEAKILLVTALKTRDNQTLKGDAAGHST